MKNNRKVIISLVGVLIMLLLIISATYAYFSVTINGNGSKTMITANTPKKHSLSVSTLYDDIHIHVDNNDMKLINAGSYYGAVDKDKRYEKTKEEGTHQIIEVSSKGMENIRYSCSGDIKVTLETKEDSMGSVLEREDVLLYLKGLGLDETLDLSTLKTNNTKVYKTTFDIDGNSSDYLSAIVELINKESYQNYIANKMLNVSVEAENMVCRENGTYKYLVTLNKNVKVMQNGNETYKWVSIFYNEEEGIFRQIQNVYFVDYINTSKAIKTWELGDTNKGTKSDEVMGWLEETPNENDSYDLYIGSEGPMRATDVSFAFNGFTNLRKISGNILDTSKVVNMQALFAQTTNLEDISALSNWDTSKVTNMSQMFYNSGISDLTSLSNWNTKNVGTMYNMFNISNNLIDINVLSNWDVSKVTNMQGMFSNTKINDISSIEKWDTSSVIYMASMFQNTLISDLAPIKNWNISKVTTMAAMFGNTPINDLTPIANWDISTVTNMNGMFSGTQITDLSTLTNWDMSHVTNIGGMFRKTPIFDLTPISNWDISSIKYIGAFPETLISDLSPISSWDVSNVTDMYEMFYKCKNLVDLSPISDWNTSNVTNIAGMFSDTAIIDLTPLSGWNVSKVEMMGDIYGGLFSNTQISDLTPLSNWDVSSLKNMSLMFQQCPNITDLSPIANWNVSNVTNIRNAFNEDIGLTKVDLSNWKMPKLSNVSILFCRCHNITELILPIAPYNEITNPNNYSDVFGLMNNVSIIVAEDQEDWVIARLIELGRTKAKVNGKSISDIS